MKVKITGLNVKFVFGRSMVLCVPRNEKGEALCPETSLAQVLQEMKTGDHEIVNAQEVLQCVVSQFGFAA